MTEPLSVRARFERFPATVKGAFVLRGEDRDPHQVEVVRARAVAVAGRTWREVPIASTTLDAAPHRDVFVPFELMVADLEPGWYGFELDLEVDGNAATFPGGRRFAVPWPRATVRRGQIRVDRTVDVGGRATATIEHVDCGGDSIRLALTVRPATAVQVRLLADGARLEVLETETDETTGRTRVTAFPLLRAHGLLRIELRGRGRGVEGALDVPLD
ncbi:MAG TPA: hypothetical protein VFZ96_09325 [Actinomycetota bacterium]|nr:hypothetical protein [Actinomycetota bacterium]